MISNTTDTDYFGNIILYSDIYRVFVAVMEGIYTNEPLNINLAGKAECLNKITQTILKKTALSF